MKKILLFVAVISTINSYSQELLKVGNKAPKIDISDYILNIPQNKNLENKFIVLEFWATWCAPCLGAVPHLNKLQDEFKLRNDLLFISLTYEKPETIKRTLNRIEFKTIVASDQTKKTELNFNAENIPYTVLIDNKGIVKWIGHPSLLQNSLIEDLLNGRDILTETSVVELEKKQNIEVNTKIDNALAFLKDKNTQYIFTLINAQKNDFGMSVNGLLKGKYIDLNNNLTSIIAKILSKPEFQILIPDSLKKNKYNLIYKNSNIADANILNNNLKSNLLNALNLKESIEKKTVEVYYLQVNKNERLNISVEEDEYGHNGDNDTHLVFSNSDIETLIHEIENFHKIIVFNQTGLDKKYDFILKKGTLDVLYKDLESYGLTLQKVSKEMDFYIYK